MISVSTIYKFLTGQRREMPKRHAKTMPSKRARVFEVQPQRIASTEYFVYRVVNLRTGEILKRTAVLALAEAMADQCQRDHEATEAIIRTEINRESIANFQARQRVA